MSWQKIKHFTPAEFRCKCGQCTEASGFKMNETFVRLLDQLRAELAFPMTVTSGFRCENHPSERAKQTPGAHSLGLAADFAIMGEYCYFVVRALHRYEGITGIGLAQKGDVDTRFLHLDAAPATPTRPRPWVWTY